MPDLHIHPLTPDLIPDFITLFGPQGACYGCWCQHFRIRPKERQTLGSDEKRDQMVARINEGPAPGLLAFQGDDPVGWMQIVLARTCRNGTTPAGPPHRCLTPRQMTPVSGRCPASSFAAACAARACRTRCSPPESTTCAPTRRVCWKQARWTGRSSQSPSDSSSARPPSLPRPGFRPSCRQSRTAR